MRFASLPENGVGFGPKFRGTDDKPTLTYDFPDADLDTLRFLKFANVSSCSSKFRLSGWNLGAQVGPRNPLNAPRLDAGWCSSRAPALRQLVA